MSQTSHSRFFAMTKWQRTGPDCMHIPPCKRINPIILYMFDKSKLKNLQLSKIKCMCNLSIIEKKRLYGYLSYVLGLG